MDIVVLDICVSSADESTTGRDSRPARRSGDHHLQRLTVTIGETPRGRSIDSSQQVQRAHLLWSFSIPQELSCQLLWRAERQDYYSVSFPWFHLRVFPDLGRAPHGAGSRAL